MKKNLSKFTNTETLKRYNNKFIIDTAFLIIPLCAQRPQLSFAHNFNALAAIIKILLKFKWKKSNQNLQILKL